MPHPREKFDSQELAVILSHYDIGIVQHVNDFARGSHQAPKAIVQTDRGRFLLKRRPRGKEDEFRVAFGHELQAYLASKHFPLPHLIGTRPDNNSMLKIGDAIYEVYEYIEGGPYDFTPESTHDAGKILALYHKLVREFHSKYEPPRGHYHDAKTVYESLPQIARTLQAAPSNTGHESETLEVVKAIKKAYKHAADEVNEIGMPKWETQIVHSDWHPGNMIFDKGHVVAVIDYDAARIRPKVMDVANGCLQFSIVTGGRDLTKWEDRTDDDRARRFLRGYDEMNVLSKAELQCIPWLMQEALIAQAVPPILKSGTFAGLDGFSFLKVMLRKVRWLRENARLLELDTAGA
jgi:Ser/Thr protein kinase RdoA (MazF antagonist)